MTLNIFDAFCFLLPLFDYLIRDVAIKALKENYDKSMNNLDAANEEKAQLKTKILEVN